MLDELADQGPGTYRLAPTSLLTRLLFRALSQAALAAAEAAHPQQHTPRPAGSSLN